MNSFCFATIYTCDKNKNCLYLMGQITSDEYLDKTILDMQQL